MGINTYQTSAASDPTERPLIVYRPAPPETAPPWDARCHVALRPRPLSRARSRCGGQPWRGAGLRNACSPLCPACSRFPRPGAHPRRGSRTSRLPPGRLRAGGGAAPSGSFRPRASAARSLTEATGDAGGSGAEGPAGPHFRRDRPDLLVHLKRLTKGNKAKMAAGLDVTSRPPNRFQRLLGTPLNGQPLPPPSTLSRPGESEWAVWGLGGFLRSAGWHGI
ncbi:uncharacterized protein LOC129783560 [Falco peregrinus]|uniref:uncharacterized protein LOC129783560 n=1 Tax=Falco peregrinus TaxID=8954 RepID=UPI00247A6EB7|nr:uncharacterized protein LOC129783560 [Falco peregrinus]